MRRCTPASSGSCSENPDVTRKLRALWALHVTAGLTENDLLALLGHGSEYLRSWAVYLLVDGKNPSDAALREFARMARHGPVAPGAAVPRERAAARLRRKALGRTGGTARARATMRRIRICR